MPKGKGKGKKGKGPYQRPTVRHVLSEDQPNTARSNPGSVEDEAPGQSQPSQMIRRITASQEENIRQYHTDMVTKLSGMFSLKSNAWSSICSRIEMLEYLSIANMGEVQNMFDLCKALKKKGKIDYGEYSKLHAVLFECDVDAGNTIDEYTERILRERRGQPPAKRQRTDEGVGQQQSTVFSREIADMIGRTKAMIEDDKKSPFIATKAFHDAKEKLEKNRVVVIKGNSGDGKTTTAIRLIRGLIEEQKARQPLQLHNIDDLDSLPPKSKLITFIDDIFGEKVAHEKDVGDWNKRIKSVLPTLCGDPHTEANFLIITIRNEVFNSLRSHTLENVFVDSNIIDLSSNDYRIKDEMLKLLESYKPENVKFSWKKYEKDEIIEYATGIGFPQCCRLFRDCSELQKERVKFFKNPFHFLDRVLENLAECNAILFLFLNGGKIYVNDLDPNGEKVDQTLLGEAFDIDLNDVVENRSAWNDKKKIEFVRKSLDTLSGFLVVKQKHRYRDGFVYKFAHDSIYSTVERLYRQRTPIGFIRYCPTRSLSLFTISRSAPDRILLTPGNYVYMFERIHRKSYESLEIVGSLDVWSNGQFIEEFVRWLNDKKIDKVDVLNKACDCGVKPFALYLLSQGVKPDKDTDWWSLVTGHWEDDVDMDTLQKVIKYMNDEMKLKLLNEACSECLVGSVKYLLSEGVKPDKDTDWGSLMGLDMDFDVDFDEDNGKKFIKYMNDEMKLDLLNKACSESVFECAFYLLSEGVKPDRDTDWLSLIVNPREKYDDRIAMDKLRDVVIYMNDEMKLDLLNIACSESVFERAFYLLSEGVKPDRDTDWLSLIVNPREDYEDCIAMVMLKSVVIYMNDEMKLDLLNKVCSEGHDELGIFLLSEGVKPNKETDWRSLVTRSLGYDEDMDMDILKSAIKYMNDEMKLFLLSNACCSRSDECFQYLLSEDVECEENTPFCMVKTENIDMLRNIVCDINDELKLSLLNVTCYTGLEECALYLLSKGGKPDNNTPFCVVRGGSVNVLCELVKYNVIPKTARSNWSKSSNKNVSLYHVSKINVLHEACLFERGEMVTLLCNAYPELVHDTDEFGHTPMLLAAMTGNCGIFHTVESVIPKTLYRVEDKQHKCETVDSRVVHRKCVCAQYMSQVLDLYRGTILNVICEKGHFELCVYICQSYPELAIVENKYGITVLHSTCFGGNGEICKYLCQLYPVLTAVVDSYGCHILHYMARFILDSSLFSECEIVVKQYLESIGQMYDITTILDNNERTVLHESCESGNKDLCVYLCQTYPELTTAVDKDGRTVLHVSCERRDREMCKYLCETFPELTTAVDKDGGHCLHYLAKYNMSDVDLFTKCEVYVKQYLESLGQKYDIKTILNNRGQSVFDVVKDKSAFYYPLYRYLLQFFIDEV